MDKTARRTGGTGASGGTMARRSSGVVDAGSSGYPPGGFATADPWDPPPKKGRRGRGDRRGWGGSGGGRPVLQSAQVSSVDPDAANHAIVRVRGGANDRSSQLAVPVYAKAGAMEITGRPALLAAPPRASAPAVSQDRDSALESG